MKTWKSFAVRSLCLSGFAGVVAHTAVSVALAQTKCNPTSCTGVIERLYVADDKVFVSLLGGMNGLRHSPKPS